MLIHCGECQILSPVALFSVILLIMSMQDNITFGKRNVWKMSV